MTDNVVPFPAHEPNPAYTVAIWYVGPDLHWSIETDSAIPADADLASDLASIAVCLRPPRRTFLERLRDLFTGD